MLAPICLFVYNRPNHTQKTLEAISQNEYAKDSILYIFCDGPKNDHSKEEIEGIALVREIIRKKKWCKTVIIFESKKNKGLANSIIFGVDKIIKKHGRIIVLEDDLITGRYFLKYMNMALKRYKYSQSVKQISGFSYPIKEYKKNNLSYFLPISSTWGWATWDRVWNEIDFECENYQDLLANKREKFKFNFNGAYNYSKLLKQQMDKNKVSSWGIRFYYNVFINKGIVLFPDYSLVKNIGWDNSGRHGASYELYKTIDWNPLYEINKFPNENVDMLFFQRNVKYLKQENFLIKKIVKKILSYFKMI